jgi:hypothetical protein
MAAREGDRVSGTPLPDSAAHYLRKLRGVVAAAPVDRGIRSEALASEESYERGCTPPVSNLALRMGLARVHVLAILKDRSFRRPPTPTLYLVEEGEAPPSEVLVVEGRRYHVIGEECLAGDTPPAGCMPVSETFYLYPERRSDPGRAAAFLLPPVRFPEMEDGPWAARVRHVVSASPSAVTDVLIRSACGFAQDPRLATLILGFDPAPSPSGAANRTATLSPS